MRWLPLAAALLGCGTNAPGPGPQSSAAVPPGEAATAATPTTPTAQDPSTVIAVDPALLPDLALLRAHDQNRWEPSSEPAVRAAGRVFAGIHFEGASTTEVERLLGPPLKVGPDGTWAYYFHNGESGVVRAMHIAGGRVVRVRVVLTQ